MLLSRAGRTTFDTGGNSRRQKLLIVSDKGHKS